MERNRLELVAAQLADVARALRVHHDTQPFEAGAAEEARGRAAVRRRPGAVPPGWAPYRFGHWVWIAPWGWTWVDDAPWGFAPFHYGRWVIINGVWVWVPGPPRIRPIYAPALVVFVGGGTGMRWHFEVGMGLGVGWFPLGPREVYLPPYRTSRIYITNVNISHTVIVNPANKVSRLTREQIEGIYSGKIKNWKEVGGDDMVIVAYARETSSGTYEFFKEHVLQGKDFAASAQTMIG